MIDSIAACPARYEYAGLFKTSDSWIHPVRTIDSYEIMLIIAGKVCLFQDSEQYELSPGDLIVLQPGLRHGGWKASEGETSFYWIHFRAAEPLPPLPFSPRALEDASRLNALCRQLLHSANSPGYPDYAVQAAFSLLFCELTRLKNGESSESRLINEIAEWIRINSRKRITVESAARQAGYHPDYLSALFRATFGLNLKQYITGQRMSQIRSLLLTTADPIKQLASELDFDNENQFIHYFRYHEGVSPARYRNLFHHTHLNRS